MPRIPLLRPTDRVILRTPFSPRTRKVYILPALASDQTSLATQMRNSNVLPPIRLKPGAPKYWDTPNHQSYNTNLYSSYLTNNAPSNASWNRAAGYPPMILQCFPTPTPGTNVRPPARPPGRRQRIMGRYLPVFGSELLLRLFVSHVCEERQVLRRLTKFIILSFDVKLAQIAVTDIYPLLITLLYKKPKKTAHSNARQGCLAL